MTIYIYIFGVSMAKNNLYIYIYSHYFSKVKQVHLKNELGTVIYIYIYIWSFNGKKQFHPLRFIY